MIVVDTSVWIDHLNGRVSPEVHLLRDLIANHLPPLLVGDLILCEILQGLSSEEEARLVEAALRRFDVQAIVNPHLAALSARNYRTLRRRGITIRKNIDLLIGTFCIEHGHALLHSDRDFDPLEEHLGLEIIRP